MRTTVHDYRAQYPLNLIEYLDENSDKTEIHYLFKELRETKLALSPLTPLAQYEFAGYEKLGDEYYRLINIADFLTQKLHDLADNELQEYFLYSIDHYSKKLDGYLETKKQRGLHKITKDDIENYRSEVEEHPLQLVIYDAFISSYNAGKKFTDIFNEVSNIFYLNYVDYKDAEIPFEHSYADEVKLLIQDVEFMLNFFAKRKAYLDWIKKEEEEIALKNEELNRPAIMPSKPVKIDEWPVESSNYKNNLLFIYLKETAKEYIDKYSERASKFMSETEATESDYIDKEDTYFETTLYDLENSESTHDGFSLSGIANFEIAYAVVMEIGWEKFYYSTKRKLEFLEEKRNSAGQAQTSLNQIKKEEIATQPLRDSEAFTGSRQLTQRQRALMLYYKGNVVNKKNASEYAEGKSANNLYNLFTEVTKKENRKGGAEESDFKKRMNDIEAAMNALPKNSKGYKQAKAELQEMKNKEMEYEQKK